MKIQNFSYFLYISNISILVLNFLVYRQNFLGTWFLISIFSGIIYFIKRKTYQNNFLILSINFGLFFIGIIIFGLMLFRVVIEKMPIVD